MVTCQICGKEFRVITHTHLKKHNLTIEQYMQQFPDMEMYSEEYERAASISQKGKKMGDDNPARRKNVRDKIACSVKKQWDEGAYKDRVNGMTNICGDLHPNYKAEIHTLEYLAETRYVQFLKQYQDVSVCSKCGRKKEDGYKIQVHHIDEDRSNFLPSNLEPLCVHCHMLHHYTKDKTPFISIGKLFSFAAAHFLPNYEGPCANLHGHEWRLEIVIEKRIDKDTNMVMDFGDLKQIVNKHIVNQLDHSYVNDVVPHPTAENMLIWIWEILVFVGLLKGLKEISLWETPTSRATLNKEGMLSIVKQKIEDYVGEIE